MRAKSRRQNIAADTQSETTFGEVAQNLVTHSKYGPNQRNMVIYLFIKYIINVIILLLLVLLF